MSTLTIRGVSRSFGPVPAVVDLDLTVPQGSLTAVLGPSGCGKTTLLRLVAGFLAPDDGTIAFDDEVVAGAGRSVPARRRRVGYVPQEGALFPHLDVAANIAFGLPRRERGGRSRAAAGPGRLAELLDLVELPAALASRRPHELSGGQQQRVAVARALAPRPSVVLLDEPFSSLDASLRASTGRAVSRALRAAGATAVLVTHDQAEALSLADQVAVMRAGRLVQAATPEELYRAPVDADVARFVGGAAVVAATVDAGTATCRLGRLELARTCPPGEAHVLVRPEQLRLTPATATGPTAAGVPGLVEEVSFYGHDASVRVRLLPGGPLVVARTAGLDAPAAGSDVSVSVDGPVVALGGLGSAARA